MRLRHLRFASLALAFSLFAAAGCEDTAPARTYDMPAPEDMASGPDLSTVDLAAPIEFEAFVLSLINTQTSNTTKPTTTEDKAFVDSMDPSKFNSLFP